MRIAKKLMLVGFFFILTLIFVSPIQRVQADPSLLNSQEGLIDIGQAYGNANPRDIRITVARTISVVLGFLGVIMVVVTLYAGFLYMTAGGNEEKVKEAVTWLRNAIIGLLIILMAWAITRYTIVVLSHAVANTYDYLHYR